MVQSQEVWAGISCSSVPALTWDISLGLGKGFILGIGYLYWWGGKCPSFPDTSKGGAAPKPEQEYPILEKPIIAVLKLEHSKLKA